MQGPKPAAFLRRCSLLLLLWCAPFGSWAQALSLSFEGGLDPRIQPEAAAWNARLLQALEQAQVRAMLFPLGQASDSEPGLALVRAWGEAGHAIGNLTYSGRAYGSPRVSFADFSADVLAADALLREMPGWTPRLRFPGLQEGESADKRDRMRDWMTLHGYEAAPVSIDTCDACYDERWQAWRQQHPGADPARWREAYLTHLWGRAQHYDALARRLLGRSPVHVLRLHANGLNAEFLDEAIEMFRRRGWRIVPPEEALADPLYRKPVDTLPAGEGVLWARAKRAKLPGLRHPPEDVRYEKPRLDKLAS